MNELIKPKGSGLTSDGYFSNANQECIMSSLANLIYFKYHDFETAKNIFLNSKKHLLVKNNLGIHIISIPLIIRNLSKEKYSGKLFFIPGKNFLTTSDKTYNRILKKTFNESMKLGLFDFTNNYGSDFPRILFLRNLRDSSITNSIVDLGNFKCINDGNIEEFSLNDWKILAVFKIFKKKML